ncbi:MAG: MFS transporter [Rhabdochlamydiaceae bacterium]|nr:MFS transporter [Rhabdochlamydiaceae bacterium]
MSNTAKKTTLLASLGAGLEYYDFIIYGMMSSTLSTLFFSADSPHVALLKTFGVFAVGYAIRPLGGILFGMIGDTYGRKSTFLAVMLLMALATIGIGLLPTYGQVGIAAPCLLLFFRLAQGLSFGAELPGAVTVVSEHTKKQRHGIYSGFVISSVSIGATLASFILFLLSKSVAQEQILSWGWRIPFLLGGGLAVANYFIRKHLEETPQFSQLQKTRARPALKEPLLSLIRFNKTELVCGIFMTMALASLVIFSLYLPTYLTAHFAFASQDIYLAMTYGMLWSALSLPLCGWISDRLGQSKTFIGTCVLFVLGVFGLFSFLRQGQWGSLLLFMILYQTVISFLSVSYFALLSSAFSTAVRFTGIALCYNVAYSAMSCSPILITALIFTTNKPASAIWFLIAFALFGMTAAYVLSKRSLTTDRAEA